MNKDTFLSYLSKPKQIEKTLPLETVLNETQERADAANYVKTLPTLPIETREPFNGNTPVTFNMRSGEKHKQPNLDDIKVIISDKDKLQWANEMIAWCSPTITSCDVEEIIKLQTILEFGYNYLKDHVSRVYKIKQDEQIKELREEGKKESAKKLAKKIKEEKAKTDSKLSREDRSAVIAGSTYKTMEDMKKAFLASMKVKE